MAPPLERTDIQRLLLYGLAWRPASACALLTIEDSARAGAWLARQLAAGAIPNAQVDPESQLDSGTDAQLFVGFTYDGLRQLGLSREVLRTFLPEFCQGMTAPHRARVIGDTDHSAWSWGNASHPVHLLCAAYAREPRLLPNWSAAAPDGCRLVHHVATRCAAREPFGFRDGLSQPYVDGSGRDDSDVPAQDRLAAGEFVLGYANAFGVLPASPYIEAPASSPIDLPALPLSRALDLGKNGSYLVVRDLAQDVAAFQALDPVLQARLVGRWHSGKSLTAHPPDSTSSVSVSGPDEPGNDFGYFAEDSAGLRCPLAAHVRRVNPRDGLADPGLGITPAEALRRANQHRLLRRSRRSAEGDGSGLLFMCFNANLERQFEFVQQAWINRPDFAGPRPETDPLVGNHPGEFSVRAGPDREVVRQGLQAFVRVRGGGYFFLPGLRALRYLAGLGSGARRFPAE